MEWCNLKKNTNNLGNSRNNGVGTLQWLHLSFNSAVLLWDTILLQSQKQTVSTLAFFLSRNAIRWMVFERKGPTVPLLVRLLATRDGQDPCAIQPYAGRTVIQFMGTAPSPANASVLSVRTNSRMVVNDLF